MAVGDKVLASWLNNHFTTLTTTIPGHNIPTGVTANNVTSGDFATAISMNNFLNKLLALRTNEFLRWADNWTLGITTVSSGDPIKHNLKANTDTLMTELAAMNGNYS